MDAQSSMIVLLVGKPGSVGLLRRQDSDQIQSAFYNLGGIVLYRFRERERFMDWPRRGRNSEELPDTDARYVFNGSVSEPASGSFWLSGGRHNES